MLPFGAPTRRLSVGGLRSDPASSPCPPGSPAERPRRWAVALSRGSSDRRPCPLKPAHLAQTSGASPTHCVFSAGRGRLGRIFALTHPGGCQARLAPCHPPFRPLHPAGSDEQRESCRTCRPVLAPTVTNGAPGDARCASGPRGYPAQRRGVESSPHSTWNRPEAS